MKIRPIRTDEDYDSALARVEDLFHSTNPEESDERDVLAVLIDDYARRKWPRQATPAAMLRSIMDSRGLTGRQAALELGCTPSRISEILHGRITFSKSMLIHAARNWGIEPGLLLGDVFVAPDDGPVGANQHALQEPR